MKKITLKTLLSGLALTLCLVSPLSAQQKRYDGVTIHTNSLGGAWDELITDVVVKPLKEQYGFTVVLHPETITVSLSKLLVDVKNPPYDVFHTDSTTLPTLLETNAVEDLDPKFVPEFANVYPQMKEGGNKAAPWFTAPMVIAYRTDLVKNPPKTMTDLAKPEFKGAVGLYNVENAGGIMDLRALAMEQGGELKNIVPGCEALVRCMPNVGTTP
ncbi:MAG: extracellular solute-binding protein, partial [Parvibaculaceae bacterium]